MLVRGGGGLVMVLAGASTHGQCSQEGASVGWDAGAAGGKLFPEAVVHWHVRCVEWELPG